MSKFQEKPPGVGHVNPASPCINVCRMNDPLGLCEGCGRTLDEIASWGQMDAVRKDAVWRLLPQRLTYLRMAGVAPAQELPRQT